MRQPRLFTHLHLDDRVENPARVVEMWLKYSGKLLLDVSIDLNHWQKPMAQEDLISIFVRLRGHLPHRNPRHLRGCSTRSPISGKDPDISSSTSRPTAHFVV